MLLQAAGSSRWQGYPDQLLPADPDAPHGNPRVLHGSHDNRRDILSHPPDKPRKADRSGCQWPRTASGSLCLPEFIARLLHELHRTHDESLCLFTRKAFSLKTFNRCLIARTRRDIGTSCIIIIMDCLDESRLLKQSLGRPEFIIRVESAPRKLRAECTIQHYERILLQIRCDDIHFISSLLNIPHSS